MSGSANGHIVIRRQAKDGKDGQDGSRGAKPRHRLYSTGTAYQSGAAGEDWFDVVYHVEYQQFFTCIKSYPASETHSPSLSTSNAYWEYNPALESFFVDMLCANSAFINKLVASSAFITALTAVQATILKLTVGSVDTAPSASNNKVKVDGDGLIIYDDDGHKKVRISNDVIGVYDDLLFEKNPSYLSSGLAKTRTIGKYLYQANSNYYLNGEIFGFLNLGYCDIGSVIKLSSFKMKVSPTSSNSNIKLTLGTPHYEVCLCRDGVIVTSVTVTAGSTTISMGESYSYTYSPGINYTVKQSGNYYIRITPYEYSGPVVAISPSFLVSSSSSGTVNITVDTTYYFSLTRSNYEFTHIGNNGMMQVMGSGFLFSGSSEFVVRRGTYMLRLSSTGLQKSTNGGSSWTDL